MQYSSDCYMWTFGEDYSELPIAFLNLDVDALNRKWKRAYCENLLIAYSEPSTYRTCQKLFGMWKRCLYKYLQRLARTERDTYLLACDIIRQATRFRRNLRQLERESQQGRDTEGPTPAPTVSRTEELLRFSKGHPNSAIELLTCHCHLNGPCSSWSYLMDWFVARNEMYLHASLVTAWLICWTLETTEAPVSDVI
jgi:hypothetical protein